MKAFTNGFPKSGNHALVKAVQLLGVPCEVNHEPFTQDRPCVFIKRDPRNVVLSWLRHKGQPIVAGMVMTHLRDFEGGQTLTEAMRPFEGWLTAPSALIVRYEDLIASDAEMRRIAQHLGVPYVDGAWQWLPGLTRTWHPAHSDWAQLWTPQVQAVFEEIGGPALLERWGY